MWRQWILVASAWWCVNASIIASHHHSMGGASWSRAISVAFWGAVNMLPVTVFAFWLAHRVPLTQRTAVRAVAVHVTAALSVVLMRAVVVSRTNALVSWYEVLPPFTEVLRTSVANNFPGFLLLVGIGYAQVFAWQARERHLLLARAELQYLQAQLQPHFLFNTLNAISSYVRVDPERATQMIARLSTLLRRSLDNSQADEVTLEEELHLLAAYVDIEQARFEDRLRVIWAIAPETLRAQVPSLLLQPLVENAIRHGIAPQRDGGVVEISASRRNGSLALAVADNGGGIHASPNAGGGLGLANSRSRLERLYGQHQSLNLSPNSPRGVRVDVEVPWRERSFRNE
jgi:two-component system, LytTR family, sensor kinase